MSTAGQGGNGKSTKERTAQDSSGKSEPTDSGQETLGFGPDSTVGTQPLQRLACMYMCVCVCVGVCARAYTASLAKVSTQI